MAKSTIIHQLLKDFENLFLPETCRACQDVLLSAENLICTQCLLTLPTTGWINPQDNKVYKLFDSRYKIESAMSLYRFSKDGRVQNLVHQLKYQGQKKLGFKLGEMIGNELKKTNFPTDIDVICPVPLHPKKEKARGYNQSWLLAKGIEKSLGAKAEKNLLLRKKHTDTQTRKSRIERLLNTKEVFECTPMTYGHLLLVDDVITTGATIESCIDSILAQNKNLKISIVSLALAQ